MTDLPLPLRTTATLRRDAEHAERQYRAAIVEAERWRLERDRLMGALRRRERDAMVRGQV